MKIALIGAGGIGKLWSQALSNHPSISITVVADHNETAARACAEAHNAQAVTDWHDAISADVDAAIIAVPHASLAPVSQGFLEAGKHVLSEKPGGISSQEIEALEALAERNKLVYMIGFNHRYHPAYMEARKRFEEGAIGNLLFIRARYGFGGRAGYEKEWRFKKDISGGGELLDQGIHMIDMARQFMGDPEIVHGFAEHMFWDGEVEDNGFILMKNHLRQVAQIHVSWTNWEWIHSFEIYGSEGYLVVEGLDSRYRGPERLVIGHADPRSGKLPEEKTVTYPDERKEDSLRREAEEFSRVISGETRAIPRGEDARAALTIVEHIYENK